MPDPPDPIETANKLLGVPYVWGGDSPSGVDCSGLIHQIYPSLPRTAHLQKWNSTPIQQAQAQRGDLVFLHGTQHNPPVPSDWASHVGIYDGAGNVIHASSVHGKVISVPLSQWTSNPNFYGFGRPNGISPMPPKTSKTKGAGLATAPAPSAPLNLAQATNADGSINPGGLLAGVGNAPPTPFPTLNDPFAPQTAPNPTYNPTPDTADVAMNLPAYGKMGGADLGALLGGGLPYDDQQNIVTGPSLRDQQFTAQKQSASEYASPEEEAAAKLEAHAKLNKSLADVLRLNPAPQYTPPDFAPAPAPQFADVPQRQAPGYDPMSNAFAALAGLVDPRAAGQYAQAPLEAGLQVAQRNYEDRERQFAQVSQQLAAQHEADLQNWNAKRQADLQKAGANYENAVAAQKQAILGGNLGAEGDADLSHAGQLAAFADRNKQSALYNITAGQAGQSIQDILGQNQAAIANYNTQEANRIREQQNLLLFGGKLGTAGINADAKRDVELDRSETARKIAEGRNAALQNRANTLADAGIKRANIAAKSHMDGINAKISADLQSAGNGGNGAGAGLPAQTRIAIQNAGTVWVNAEKAVQTAENQARRQYVTDPNAGTFNSVEDYVAKATAPAQQRAAAAKAAYDALQASAKAAPAPAPPAPAAGKTKSGNGFTVTK